MTDPYTSECSYEWLRPADLRPFDPCRLTAMAGNARQYQQPGWEFSHMAQALVDASAEAIANMSLEKLREAVHRDHSGDACSLLDAEGGSTVSVVAAETHLRAVLTQRARQCRTQIFGDAALGSLEVSYAASDDLPIPHGNTPETEDSLNEDEDDERALLPPRPVPARIIGSKSCPVGRLDKHVREYMVDVLQSWSANNPNEKMPSKEEKMDLIGRCSDATGCDVTIRHLEYWFWQRNKLRNKQLKSSSNADGGIGYGSTTGLVPPPSALPQATHQTGVLKSAAESEAESTRARIQAERTEGNFRAERQRFEVYATQVATRYLRHLQETPLSRQVHARGGACSPPCLRVRPVEATQPLVVVHPLAIREPNQPDDAQKAAAAAADSTNLAGMELCEHLMREESASIGRENEASDEKVFCPRFSEDKDYEKVLTARYVRLSAQTIFHAWFRLPVCSCHDPLT